MGPKSWAIFGRLRLGPRGQLDLLDRADLPGLAAVPVAAHLGHALGVLVEPLLAPGRSVLVHVLVVVVQSEEIPAGLDPPGGLDQALVAAALRRGRQDVGMAHVVAPIDPAGQDHEGPVDAQIVPPVLGALGHFIEGEAQVDVLLLVAAEHANWARPARARRA